MSIKMKDVFVLPVHVTNIELNFSSRSSGAMDCAADKAINNHDALVEALEWALERAEPEVRETDNSMDQMMLIKYQKLLQEVK